MPGSRSPDGSVWARVLGTWLVLAVVMSANGIFRELVLRRLAGPGAAAALSAGLGVTFILLVTRLLYPDLRSLRRRNLVRVSVVMVALTLAFETMLGRLVDGRSWAELGAHYAFWRGELWPGVLLVLALTPFVWGRWMPRLEPRADGRAGSEGATPAVSRR